MLFYQPPALCLHKGVIMKFFVDETPNFYDECPFSKEEWADEGWRGFCTLVNEKCNLHESGCSGECHGLKRMSAGNYAQ